MIIKRPLQLSTTICITLFLSGLNHSISVKANPDNFLSKGVELFMSGVVAGVCTAGVTALWYLTVTPPHVELSKIEETKQLFQVRQESLVVMQDALTKAAAMLQQFGPHLPREEREALERQLMDATSYLQSAGEKFANKYRPEYLKYVQNL